MPAVSFVSLLPRFLACLVTGKSLWQLFLEQFDDLLIKILLGAAVISFVRKQLFFSSFRVEKSITHFIFLFLFILKSMACQLPVRNSECAYLEIL